MHIHSLRSTALLSLILFTSMLTATPNVTQVNPHSGTVAGGNSVTITGNGFTRATAVHFGNQAATFVVINDSTIQAIAPLNSPGANEITVTVLSGTSPLNPPADYYTYQGDWFAYIPDFGSATVIPIQITSTPIPGTAIPVQTEPNDVAVTPDGKLATVVNSGSNSLTWVDVATQTAFFSLPLDISFPILAITPDGTHAAIVSYGSNTVTFVNLKTFAVRVVPVGSAPTSIAMVPSGVWAYVTNAGSSSLTVINTQTFATFEIPGPVGSIPSFIAITPDGTKALVTDDATNSVYIFNPENLTFGTQIFGFFLQGPNLYPEIGITPDGATAWITNTSSNTISSIVGLNTATPSFGSSIVVDSHPNGIAITPDGKQAYVSNATSNNVSIVTFATATSTNLAVGTLPTDPAITPDQAPVAYFNFGSAISGQAVQFDASTSISPTGNIMIYTWNFGDGTPIVNSVSPYIAHTYTQSGNFFVTLTVTNSAGTSLVRNYTGQVTLNNGGPSATLTINLSIDPSSVLQFKGTRCKNKFASQTEYVNQLFWQPSSDPAIVSYQLFRNGVLIATIPSNAPLLYIDHDRAKKVVDIYSLVAVDASGLKSAPIIIEVP